MRLRVGGNAIDISTYVKSQTQFLNVTDPAAQQDHIPVTFGPTLLNVMNKVSQDIGGAEYIMGKYMLCLGTFSDPSSKPRSQLIKAGRPYDC